MIFRPKEDKFTVLLSKISSNLKTAANYYYDFPIRNVSDLKACAAEMKRYENTGDSYVHELIMELNNAFITPLDREDILQLAMSMDDVLDGLESITAMINTSLIVKSSDKIAPMPAYKFKTLPKTSGTAASPGRPSSFITGAMISIIFCKTGVYPKTVIMNVTGKIIFPSNQVV